MGVGWDVEESELGVGGDDFMRMFECCGERWLRFIGADIERTGRMRICAFNFVMPVDESPEDIPSARTKTDSATVIYLSAVAEPV
jgi:hypothetical protein